MAFFFRSRPRNAPGRELERELEKLEKQASSASAGYETQYLTRAGNLCVDAGQTSRALSYFGRAIDAYLESGRFSAAEVLCRRLLTVAPDVVRTRCTLVWLSLVHGPSPDTYPALAEYVRASRKAGRDDLTRKRLALMVGATSDLELRERIADHLLELGANVEADQVYGIVFRERGAPPRQIPTDEGALWARVLRAALMGPEELIDQPNPLNEDGVDHNLLPALTRDER